MAIEIRNWYPGMITGVTEQEISLSDSSFTPVENPLFHARQYLSVISRRITDHPELFSQLIAPEDNGGGLCFQTSYVLLLPNCTQYQMTSHQLGDLYTYFDPARTFCREMLLEIEQWEPEEVIPFLRAIAGEQQSGSPLTREQIHLLRAVIHPDIIIGPSSGKGRAACSPAGIPPLTMLDYQQEKNVYLIRQGHQIVAGVAGSGKTTILTARARILHHNKDARILVLCANTVLSEWLCRVFSGYPRIYTHSFGEWAEKQGIIRKKVEEGGESDQEFGARLNQQMQCKKGDYHAYDAVLIDEAQDFPPSWILCAKEALKDPDCGDLLIVTDESQRRYGWSGASWKELGIHARGRIHYQNPELGQNYRNTKEIQDIARIFLHGVKEEDSGDQKEADCPFSSPSRNGLKPLLVWNTTHASQGDYTVFLIRRLLGSIKSAQYLSGIRPDDIAVMYPHAEEQDLKVLEKMVSDLGRFCPVQWVSENDTAHVRIHLPGVKVHDARSIKGMQYRAVMMLFSEYFDLYGDDPRYCGDQNLFYMALTRPSDFLTILYSEKTSLIRKILSSCSVDEFIGK
jgi:energy-coupling factor transporter ATP-binding protein EcfA2